MDKSDSYSPEYHDRVRMRHRAEWGKLHDALDELERWFKEGTT